MISFHDWIFSVYPPNSKIEGAWGPLHIVTMLLIVGAIVGFTFLFGKKSDKTKRTLLFVIVGILLKQDFQWVHIIAAPQFITIDIKLFLMAHIEMLWFNLPIR